MVLTEAAGDIELALWDGGEFGHPRFTKGITSKSPSQGLDRRPHPIVQRYLTRKQ